MSEHSNCQEDIHHLQMDYLVISKAFGNGKMVNEVPRSTPQACEAGVKLKANVNGPVVIK